MARVLAISNQKGGVGKTTTAINLSASLALDGQRVLLVDLDPQGNASSGLGLPRAQNPAGAYDWVMEYRPFPDVVRATSVERLSIVPATDALVGLEIELQEEEHPHRRLRKVLADARAAWDWVVLDCPPSLGLITINALTAADAVLVPLQAEYFAMEGLGALLQTIHKVRKGLNPDLVVDGVVITMTDARNNLCREVEMQARDALGAQVLATTIARNVRLAESPSFGRPVVEYDPRSRGARDYRDLAKELRYRRSTDAAARRVAS